MKKILLLVAILVLTACSNEQNTPPIAAPLPVVSSGEFDGTWTGKGTDAVKGKNFEFSFSVRDSRITDIRYSFNGKDNIPGEQERSKLNSTQSKQRREYS